MLSVSPVRVSEWEVTGEVASAVDSPYAVGVPYSICESEASSVVQLIVAVEVVMLALPTLEMTGGVVSGGVAVVKVKSPDTARLPAASFDFTR